MLQAMFGTQSAPPNSFFRRLDARTRLLVLLTLMLVLVTSRDIAQLALVLLAVAVLLPLAQLALSFVWRGFLLMLPWLLLVGLLQLLFGLASTPDCSTLWAIGPLRITDCSLQLVASTTLRFLGLLMLLGLFVWTIPVPELARAIDSLSRPLRRIGLPAHELALAAVIAVRFVPTMALELERLRKAQIARGADWGQGRFGFVQRVRRTLPMIVPLFLLALRRAERLAEAMDARAYTSGAPRGSYSDVRLRTIDWIVLLAGLLLLIGFFLIGGMV